MDINTMTKAMLNTLPDLFKKRTQDRLYVKMGNFTEKNSGFHLMANRGCTCGGRGYTSYDSKKRMYIRCKCVISTELPLEFIVLPKKRFVQGTV